MQERTQDIAADEDAAALASEPPFEVESAGRRVPWGLLIKTLITVALVWLIVSKVDFAEVGARLGQIDAFWPAVALALIVLQYLSAALRWSLILRGLDTHLPARRVGEIFLIGLFFNQALPSSIGGDAMRAWRSHKAGLPLGRAVSSVVLDRTMGFVTLFVLAVVGLPWSLQLLAGHPMRWLTPAFAAAAFASLGLLLTLDKLLPLSWRRFRLVRGLAGLAHDGRRVLLHPATLTAMLAVSLASALSVVSVYYVLAAALDLKLSFLSCVLLVPVIQTVTAVPVSLAGWGVREGISIFLFGLVGLAKADALALSLCFGLLAVVTCLPGGLVWLLTRERERTGPKNTAKRAVGG